jgi:hypothetical protein
MTTEKHQKRPTDTNQLAKRVIDIATSEEPEIPAKDPAAVALGRRGGLKGGKARAEKLSPEQRADIARRAAQSRWGRDS